MANIPGFRGKLKVSGNRVPGQNNPQEGQPEQHPRQDKKFKKNASHIDSKFDFR